MAESVGSEERKALRFIARREGRGDPSPGVREIGCAVGLEESRRVQELLSRLVDHGYLIRDVGWERMLRLTDLGWRIAKDSDATEEASVSKEDDGIPNPTNVARRLLC